MLKVKTFVFNPYEENTYVLTDEKSGETAVIDPGCYSREEKMELRNWLDQSGIKVKYLLNTHCHLDHVFGNAFVKEQYKVPFLMHELDLKVLQAVPVYSQAMGFYPDQMPEPDEFIEAGQEIFLGDEKLEVIFTPGHTPGHVSFLAPAQGWLFCGDVLFRGSIGRTDLPGGSMETLMRTLQEKIVTMGDEVKVFPGHGPGTDIATERQFNPFLNGSF